MSQSKYAVIPLTEQKIPQALEVLRQSFFTDENVCTAVKLLEDSRELKLDHKYKCTVGSKELEDVGVAAAKDGVSLIAVDRSTNEVVAAQFNKLQTVPRMGEKPFFKRFMEDHLKDPSAREFIDFMIQVDARVNLFEKFDTECVFEVMYLAVKSTVKGRGIGTALTMEAVRLAQAMKDSPIPNKPVPKVVSAIYTARGSQACGTKSGFSHILKIPFSEFKYKGKTYAETIGPDHPFCTLSVKKLY